MRLFSELISDLACFVCDLLVIKLGFRRDYFAIALRACRIDCFEFEEKLVRNQPESSEQARGGAGEGRRGGQREGRGKGEGGGEEEGAP